MLLIFWIEIRESDCWLALLLERNVTGRGLLHLHLLHDSYCGPHLHTVVVFFQPSLPRVLPLQRSKPMQPITALIVQQRESTGEYEKLKLSRPVGLTVWGYARNRGGGVPLLMLMSHRPQGDWASDITAAS